jgi:hypothetical protein
MRPPADATTGSTHELSTHVRCHFPAIYKLEPTQIKRKRAQKKVHKGLATWLNPLQDSILLSEQAMDSEYVDAWLFQRNSIRQSERAYDSIDRIMTLDEIPNIPICGDLSKLLTKRGRA